MHLKAKNKVFMHFLKKLLHIYSHKNIIIYRHWDFFKIYQNFGWYVKGGYIYEKI